MKDIRNEDAATAEEGSAAISSLHQRLQNQYRPCHVSDTVEKMVWELAWGDGTRSPEDVEGIYEVSMKGKQFMFTEGA